MSYAFRARASGEYPITPDAIRQRHKATVSFGATVDVQTAEALGYDTVQIEPTPDYDPATQAVQAIDPQVIKGEWVQAWQVVAIPAPELAARLRDVQTTGQTQIDDAVAAIYGRFTRFQLEYTERETQAQAYKDAGYTGDVPPRVAEFATPAGMPARNAADLILSQAANLRGAQGALSALRMRKYELLHAATATAAQALLAEILGDIGTIGAGVA